VTGFQREGVPLDRPLANDWRSRPRHLNALFCRVQDGYAPDPAEDGASQSYEDPSMVLSGISRTRGARGQGNVGNR